MSPFSLGAGVRHDRPPTGSGRSLADQIEPLGLPDVGDELRADAAFQIRGPESVGERGSGHRGDAGQKVGTAALDLVAQRGAPAKCGRDIVWRTGATQVLHLLDLRVSVESGGPEISDDRFTIMVRV